MRKLTILCLAVATVIAFGACGQEPAQQPAATPAPAQATPAPADTPAEGDTVSARDELMIVTGNLPVSMDPSMNNDIPSGLIRNLLYTTLIQLNPETMELQPGLAVSWDMPDAQTLNMQLREGVYFHNGDPFTASDVAFSIDRMLDSAFVRSLYNMIESVEIHDDFDITIHLNSPFAPILYQLTMNTAGIVSERAVNEFGEEFADNPVGTGPFKFEELILGDRLVLTRNDNYWGEAPAIREMTFRLIPEASVRLVEVETGQADIALVILDTDAQRAIDTPSVVMHQSTTFAYNFIGMNSQAEPFNDVRVRQAINYALNTDAMIDIITAGFGSPVPGPMTTHSTFVVQTEPYGFNPERAMELLAEAGFPDGFETTIMVNSGNQQRGDIAEILQNQLRAVGIEVSIEVLEFATYMERLNAGDSHMHVLNWLALTPDPDYALYSLFHSSNHGSGANRTFFHNETVDRLLDEGRAELDAVRRSEIYNEIQHLIRDEAPHVFLHQGDSFNITTPYVRGFYASPTAIHWLQNVYFVEQ